MINTLLISFVGIYSARVVYFLLGFLRERKRWRAEDYQPTVSVVVPARNEEIQIERCVQSLLAVDYPGHLIEIILIDDRSNDRTPDLMDDLARLHTNVKVFHRTPEDAEANLRGKAGALQYGIDRASGDVIMMTDADCSVNPLWVRGMAAQFADPSVAMVNAITSVGGDGVFDRIQDVEWTYTQAMACAGVGNNSPLGCFGNNLAIRRDVFNSMGGYRRITFSVTEDMALQLAVHDAGGVIRFAPHPQTNVVTSPCSTLLDYVKQRHRWVRGGTGLGMRAVWFVLSSMALWAGLAVSLYSGSWLWFWSLIILRLFADGVLIALAAFTIGRPKVLPMIIPSMILLVATELLLPILALKKSVNWKGQIFKN